MGWRNSRINTARGDSVLTLALHGGGFDFFMLFYWSWRTGWFVMGYMVGSWRNQEGQGPGQDTPDGHTI